jgi:hypothetical protein
MSHEGIDAAAEGSWYDTVWMPRLTQKCQMGKGVRI